MSSASGVTHVTDPDNREALRDEAVTLAREALYRFLGLALRGPHETVWQEGVRLAEPEFLAQAAMIVADAVSADDKGAELARRVARVAGQIRGASKDQMQEEYDRIFGLVLPKECPPCETEYIRAADVFQRSQVMADVAGFYRAFGLKPSRSAPERPDHLSLMCEFMATVLAKQRLAQQNRDQENVAICLEAAEKFFREHIAWWVSAFCRGLEKKAQDGVYADLARAFDLWFTLERMLYGVDSTGQPEPKPELIERPEQAGGCLECPLFKQPGDGEGR